MNLIIGLGNPGFRYKKTRHNAGFMAVDYIQKNIGGFSKWKNNKKLLVEISENPEPDIILAKPQTYMNKSGIAAKILITNYPVVRNELVPLPITNLFAIHDDFDIPVGKYKLEKDRGAAGHHGVQSIIDSLGTSEFWRLRIGIRPANISPQDKAEDYVLKKFTREEKTIIEKIIPKAVKDVLEAISQHKTKTRQ